MTIASQASLSMKFSKQEYWSGYALFQGIFVDPGMEPVCLMSAALVNSLPLAPPGKPNRILEMRRRIYNSSRRIGSGISTGEG